MSPLHGDDFVCAECGATKVFEIQLLPTLVNFLDGVRLGEATSQSGGGGDYVASGGSPSIDFGTILVFSCGKSCWNEMSPRLIKETVVIQAEPGKEFHNGTFLSSNFAA